MLLFLFFIFQNDGSRIVFLFFSVKFSGPLIAIFLFTILIKFQRNKLINGLEMDLVPNAHFFVKISFSMPYVHWELIDQALMVSWDLQLIEHFKCERDVAV